MASFATLTSDDLFVDLGSGRGGAVMQVAGASTLLPRGQVVKETPARAMGVELSQPLGSWQDRLPSRGMHQTLRRAIFEALGSARALLNAWQGS